jgi:hypothetical protein
MRKAFFEFLVAEGVLAPAELERVQNTLRTAPEPIGSIAFGYGMITGADIDAILDEQRADYRQFGEIAIAKRLLTRQQVENLLGIQLIRAATEIGEALVLAGICPMERVLPLLGRFLSQSQESPVKAQC